MSGRQRRIDCAHEAPRTTGRSGVESASAHTRFEVARCTPDGVLTTASIMRLNRPSPLLAFSDCVRRDSQRLRQRRKSRPRGRRQKRPLETVDAILMAATRVSFARAKRAREQEDPARVAGRGPSRRRRASTQFRSSARKRSAEPPRFLSDPGSRYNGVSLSNRIPSPNLLAPSLLRGGRATFTGYSAARCFVCHSNHQ
jgi:hypothetical protein